VTKCEQFIALNVGPCWPYHDVHEISTLLVYTIPDYSML